MINKMRFKFIIITMCALVLLLISILAATNFVMMRNNDISTDKLIDSVIQSDGLVQNQINALQPNRPEVGVIPPIEKQSLIEVFSVKLDLENEIIEVLNNDPDAESSIIEMVNIALSKNKHSGKIDDYKYAISQKEYGKIIVFANQSIQNKLLDDLKNISYIIGVISVVVLSVVVFFLSKLVIKPIKIAFEKQKRFVSDSGHELKTPLSILSANADMMEMELGNNEWLSQIKEQSRRMNKLIHELLTLAKTENEKSITDFIDFDLSSAIIKTVLPLEVVAFENNKEIECNISKNIHMRGSEKRIIEMTEALLDNAIKYSNDNSVVSVNLHSKGSKKIIEVCNKGSLAESEKQKLFDKFYRTDDSRSRETGGYGLGLSIVKNIVDMHNAKIEIDTKQTDYIIFRVIFN